MSDKITMTIDQLKALVDHMENEAKYRNGRKVALVSIEHRPNGRPYLQFEQPCEYADCVGSYHTYENK